MGIFSDEWRKILQNFLKSATSRRGPKFLDIPYWDFSLLETRHFTYNPHPVSKFPEFLVEWKACRLNFNMGLP